MFTRKNAVRSLKLIVATSLLGIGIFSTLIPAQAMTLISLVGAIVIGIEGATGKDLSKSK